MVVVSNRSERIVSYLTPDEKADLAEMADEAGKSQSDLVRDAVTEYLDRDRGDRIEEKVDEILAIVGDGETPSNSSGAHTRKHSGASETVQKARTIAERIYENHGDLVKPVDVKRAIEDVAGGDDRTIEKYKKILRERELLYSHPSSDADFWTPDKDIWVNWSEDYLNTVPDAELHDLTEEYAMDNDEYIEYVEAHHD